MNWSAVAAIVSLATLVIVIFGVVYTGGKLSQRVEDNADDLADHRERLDKHDSRHNSHEVEIAKLVQWKDGYNAEAAVSGNLERKS